MYNIFKSCFIILIVLFSGCQCLNDCPFDTFINVVLVDNTGENPLEKNVTPSDVTLFRNQEKMFSGYADGVLSFSLPGNDAQYILKIKDVPVDTLDITIGWKPGKCCDVLFVSSVILKGQSVAFKPFLTIRI